MDSVDVCFFWISDSFGLLGNTGTPGNYQSNDWSSAFANTDLMSSNVAWGIGKHLH